MFQTCVSCALYNTPCWKTKSVFGIRVASCCVSFKRVIFLYHITKILVIDHAYAQFFFKSPDGWCYPHAVRLVGVILPYFTLLVSAAWWRGEHKHESLEVQHNLAALPLLNIGHPSKRFLWSILLRFQKCMRRGTSWVIWSWAALELHIRSLVMCYYTTYMF